MNFPAADESARTANAETVSPAFRTRLIRARDGFGTTEPMAPRKSLDLIFRLPHLVYLVLSAFLAMVVLCDIAFRSSINVNEGWNAYWASAALSGSDLYPDPSSLTLNNYPPLWFYATGALGRLTGDNIQAGRILAGAALFLTAAAIALIVREITGSRRRCWFGGAAFLAIFALFYPTYTGIDDGQTTATLFMAVSLLLFLRQIDEHPRIGPIASIVGLMLIGGLIKNNVLAAPVSVAIFLALFNRHALAIYAGCAVAGAVIACGLLFVTFGQGMFSSLLFPRPFALAIGWQTAKDQLWLFNALLLVLPYLASQSNRKAKLIFSYSIVALLQGFLLSAGSGVDVNVFFDFVVAICVGIGLTENCVFEAIIPQADIRRLGKCIRAAHLARRDDNAFGVIDPVRHRSGPRCLGQGENSGRSGTHKDRSGIHQVDHRRRHVRRS